MNLSLRELARVLNDHLKYTDSLEKTADDRKENYERLLKEHLDKCAEFDLAMGRIRFLISQQQTLMSFISNIKGDKNLFELSADAEILLSEHDKREIEHYVENRLPALKG